MISHLVVEPDCGFVCLMRQPVYALLRKSEEGSPAKNTAAEYFSNPEGPDAEHSIELVAGKDRAFDVINPRAGVSTG